MIFGRFVEDVVGTPDALKPRVGRRARLARLGSVGPGLRGTGKAECRSEGAKLSVRSFGTSLGATISRALTLVYTVCGWWFSNEIVRYIDGVNEPLTSRTQVQLVVGGMNER